MTTSDPWKALAEPFPDADIKHRPGAATWDHKPTCEGKRCRQAKDPTAHLQFSYVDARAVMQRLDDVLTPSGWDFTSTVIPGTDIVRGELTIGGVVRVDYGYPNSDQDDEPIKAASSDALKRAAVMFGIGRHLYSDNTQSGGRATPPPARPPAPPRPAVVADAPEEPADLFPPIGGLVEDDETCPKHDMPWAGSPGDRWHKAPEGGYCRHPDNVKKTARRAG